MIIKNGFIYQEDKHFSKGNLYIKNDTIVTNSEQVTDDNVIDAEGLYVLPGLIDVHSHGAAGCDFSDGNPESLRAFLSYEYAHGITSCCPTTMSMEQERLLDFFSTQKESLQNLRDPNTALYAPKNGQKFSKIVGIHMEGPFLDPSKKGAHRTECLTAPDIEFFRKCNAACGNLIKLITLAPNLDGAMEFIRTFQEELTLSLGHTSTDYKTAKKALNWGANHVTHLFNAMSPFNHREPGLIGAASEDPNCYAELICDGIHVHESAVRMAFKLFPDRIVLISDSMRATGLQNGTYDLGGQQVTVKGNLATLSDGTIAGSVTNLYEGMRNAVSFGIPLEEAIAAATANPAKSVGIYEEAGSLTPGKRADVLLADKNLQLVRVL